MASSAPTMPIASFTLVLGPRGVPTLISGRNPEFLLIKFSH